MKICVVNAIAPPAAGSRSERWAHLAAALARRGHEVTVLRATLPPSHPQDHTLVTSMVREGVEIVELSGGSLPAWRYLESPALGRLTATKRLVSELVWPDAWLVFGFRSLQWLEQRSAFDYVVTSGVPFTDMLVGYEAARRLKLTWLADYGDPWGLKHVGKRWKRRATFWPERVLLHAATGVIVTTEPTRRAFTEQYGLPSARVAVISAGSTPLNHPAPPPVPPVVVLHAGHVYGVRTSISPFLEGFARYKNTVDGTARLLWYGQVWRPDERDRLRSLATVCADIVDLDTVSAAEQRAHIMVVFGNHGGIQIPAKIWRVLAANRVPFVVLADENDPLRSVPELRTRAVFVANSAADVYEGLVRAALVSRTWPWDNHEQYGPVPSWDSRAAELEKFAQRSEPRHPMPMSPSARLLATILTASGIQAGPLLERSFARWRGR